MKKQYDTKRLTDELSRSVFFQEPEQTVKDMSKQAALATSQQSRLSTKQQVDTSVHQQNVKTASNQHDLSGKKQADKATKQQNSEPSSVQHDLSASNQSSEAGSTQTQKAPKPQVNKAGKRFTSYLQEPTLKALKLLAVQTDRKDYEVLQEAVEQYLEREQVNMWLPMERIKATLEKHTIVVLNEALKHGFTQLPNYVLKEKRLSFGARLTYAVLLSYAWQEESCFPGQERLAKDLGTGERSIRRFLVELKERGFIDWKQQGLNKPNIYYLLDYQPVKLEAERTPVSGQERTRTAHLERTPVST